MNAILRDAKVEALPQPYLLFLGDTTEPGYAKTAFGLFVARLSGQRDFAIGIPFSGQALAGSGALIDDGVKTLLLRLIAVFVRKFSAFARSKRG